VPVPALMTLIRTSTTANEVRHDAAEPQPVLAGDPLQVQAVQTFAEHVADGKVPSMWRARERP
jgi:hypothetical protein